MAQVKLLKIATDGVPVEFGTSDDITLNSFSAGSVVMSATGLAMASQAISASGNLSFSSAATNGITQTAGLLAADNIMAKDRSNVMANGADIRFGSSVTDTAGNVDAFQLPTLATSPTSVPTNTGGGYAVADANGKLYIWSSASSSWVDQTTVLFALSVQNPYTAGAVISARDVVYISAADTVSPAIASAAGTSQSIGFATSGVAAAASVSVQENGVLSGFTGLTAGSRYYLSGTTAGAVTATLPVTSGHTIVQVGYAKSTTAMLIRMENMGRRA